MGLFDRSKKLKKQPVDSVSSKLHPRAPTTAAAPSSATTIATTTTQTPPTEVPALPPRPLGASASTIHLPGRHHREEPSRHHSSTSSSQHSQHHENSGQHSPFQIAGYLPPPSDWTPPFGYQPGYGPCQRQQQQPAPCQQIVVNQYYLNHQPSQQPVESHRTPKRPPHRPQTPRYDIQRHGARTRHFESLTHLTSSVPNLPGTLVVTSKPKTGTADATLRAFQDSRFDEGWHPHATQLLTQTAACVDLIASRFSQLMTSIDADKYKGHETELFTYPSAPPVPVTATARTPTPSSRPDIRTDTRPSSSSRKNDSERRPTSRNVPERRRRPDDNDKPRGTAVAKGSYFSKVHLYANSRLPADLPPLRLYMPTWPLLCLASRYAEKVYRPPMGSERDAHVPADWRTGAKAMVIKSVPLDDVSALVFAIRGSATFADWAVNFRAAPSAPDGFLDDPTNACHAGFLSVARKMVKPVAARLRQLLEEDPSRAGHSLVVTGHSAGGAVASLLYCHMLASSPAASSELNHITSAFKRVHCVVFGTPPVSERPLRTPDLSDRPELRKSLFLSFLNEGDPVARADKAYVKSLLELLASPAPRSRPRRGREEGNRKSQRERRGNGDKERDHRGSGKEKSRRRGEQTSIRMLPAPSDVEALGEKTQPKSQSQSKTRVRFAETDDPITATSSDDDDDDEGEDKENRVRGNAAPDKERSRYRKRREGPIWKVPDCSLSSPGRIVVLRSGTPDAVGARHRTVEDRLNEGVIAQTVTDEELRGVVWGDPVCHVMRLYAGRIETLAVGAVTGRGGEAREW